MEGAPGDIPKGRDVPPKRHKVPTRITVDTHAFLQDEKFSTMLDLQPAIIFARTCHEADSWTTSEFGKINHLVNADSIALLHHMGLSPIDVSSAKITPLLPAMLVKHTLTNTITKCRVKVSIWNQHIKAIMESATNSFYTQLAHLTSNTSDKAFLALTEGSDVWSQRMRHWPKEVMSAYLVSEDMMLLLELNRIVHEYVDLKTPNQRSQVRIRNINERIGSSDGSVRLESLDAQVWLTHNVCIMRWKGYTYHLTHQLLLECINKMSELYCGLLYSHMMADTALSKDHYQVTLRFWKHISGVVCKYFTGKSFDVDLHHENLGFTYLKVIEGLGAAVMIYRQDMEKGWVNQDLLNNLWQSVQADRLVGHSAFHESELGDLFLNCSLSSVSELIGTVKLCGHPSIEVEAGLEKLFVRTHENITVNKDAVHRSIAAMQRDLILSFFQVHKRYPIFKNVETLGRKPLRRMIINNINPASTEGLRIVRAIPLTDWALLRLGKNEEFDPIDNQLVLLKDKALGLIRSKVMTNVLNNLTDSEVGVKNHRRLGRIEERRALLSYLLSPHYSEQFKLYLEQYSTQDEWSKCVTDRMVIKLTAKELELKPEGRMFGASPIEERARRIVQEKNVMHLMDQYTPDQLMTPNELNMIRKLYSFRHFNHMYPNHTLFQVSFDFSKWNNSMRSEVVDVAGGVVLDGWFGTNIYSKTMKMYQHSLVYYADSMRTRHWEGQLGGIEGLNQATWSFVFLGGIKQALDELGIKYQVTVKGDDVRAVLAVPNTSLERDGGIEAVRDDILHQLSELCKAMGWSLNPHECFVSLSLICTSKQYQINDTWMGASTKKILKLTSLADLLLPTMEDLISSIFSTAHSACSQTTSVFAPYACAMIVAAREFCRCYLPMKSVTASHITMMLLWPQCLGGPGVLPLQTFMVRGENDMVSVSLSLMRYILNNNMNGLYDMTLRVLSQQLTKDPDVTLLLSDPFSLPFELPQSPKAVLKNLIRSQLKCWIKNPDLAMLFDAKSSEDMKLLQKRLCSMRPYLAKVATTLWECSPFYIIEEVVGRFTQSATVFAFLCRQRNGRMSYRRGHRLLQRVLTAATKRHHHWLSTLLKIGPEDREYLGSSLQDWTDPDICTTKFIHVARELAWGFKVEGITYPSLVDQNMLYHPEDLTALHPNWDINAVTTAICIPQAKYEFQTVDKSHHYATIPNHKPWLGAHTSSKLELPNMAKNVSSPTISKITRLLNIMVNVPILGNDFKDMLYSLISSLTPIPVSRLKFLSPESGQSHIAHRTPTNSTPMNTSPNYRPNLQQIVMMTNDAGGALRGDRTNRTVNFAARNYFLTFLSILPLQSRQLLPVHHPTLLLTVFHYSDRHDSIYNVCPYCCNDVDETGVRFTEGDIPDLSRYTHLPLVGCSSYENTVLQQNMTTAIEGKTRRYALNQYQDPNDPRITALAALTLVHHFGSIHSDLHAAARAQEYVRVPTGALLEAVAVNLNIKSIRTVSVNSLRCMLPINLYRAILHETIGFVLDVVGSNIDLHELLKVEHVMPHIHPLASVFGEFGSKDLLLSIQVGAREAGLVLNFTWTSGCGSSGMMAASTFIQQHMSLFRRWLFEGEHMPRLLSYVHMEDDTTLDVKLSREVRKLTNLLLCIARRQIQACPFLTTLVNVLASVGCYHMIPAEYSIYVKHDVVQEVLLQPPASFTSQGVARALAALILPVLCQGEMSTAARVVLSFITTMMLDQAISPGNWSIEGYVGVIVGKEFTIVTMPTLYESMGLLEANWRDLHMYPDFKGFQWYVERVGKQVTEGMYLFTMTYEDLYTPLFMQHLDAIWDHIRISLQPINTRLIGAMRADDAERISSAQQGNISKQLDLMRQHLVETAIMDRSDLNIIDDMNCRFSSRRVHDQMYTIGMPGLDAGYGRFSYIAGQEIVGARYNDRPFRNHYWADPTEMTRVLGVHNTSPARYMEIFTLSGYAQFQSGCEIPNLAICLADGLGGVSAQVLTSFPRTHVIYNSLYVMGPTLTALADADPYNPPIEIMSLPDSQDILARVTYKGLYPGDLTDDGVVRLLIHTAKTKHLPVSLVTCDVDVDWSDNLRAARTLWMNILYIHLSVGGPQTLLILRCFCIEHPVVRELLHTVGCLYAHFHFERSSAHKVRSTEFFIIAKEPRDSGKGPSIVRSIYAKERQFRQSYEICDKIDRFMRGVVEQYQGFRQTGIMKTKNIAAIYDTYRTLHGNPLNVTAITLALGAHFGQRQHHLCNFLDDFYLSCSTDARDVESMLLEVRTRSRGSEIVLKSGRGATLAKGVRLLHALVRRFVRLSAVTEVFYQLRSAVTLPIMPDCARIVERVIDLVAPHMRGWGAVAYIYKIEGQAFFVTKHFSDNLTFTVYAAIKKSMQVFGSWCYTLKTLEAAREDWIVKAFSSSCTYDTCCYEKSMELFASYEPWSITVRANGCLIPSYNPEEHPPYAAMPYATDVLKEPKWNSTIQRSHGHVLEDPTLLEEHDPEILMEVTIRNQEIRDDD